MSSKVALILNYQFPGKFALNVLAGAVAADEALREVPLDFPRSREALLAQAAQRLEEGRRVVVAWSFYSESFPAAAQELSWLRERLPGEAQQQVEVARTLAERRTSRRR